MSLTEKIVIAKISAKIMNSFKVMQFIYKTSQPPVDHHGPFVVFLFRRKIIFRKCIFCERALTQHILETGLSKSSAIPNFELHSKETGSTKQKKLNIQTFPQTHINRTYQSRHL